MLITVLRLSYACVAYSHTARRCFANIIGRPAAKRFLTSAYAISQPSIVLAEVKKNATHPISAWHTLLEMAGNSHLLPVGQTFQIISCTVVLSRYSMAY